MSISIHDNFITGYDIRCEQAEICLHTEFRDKGEPFEYTDVIFTGVEAYQFQYDNFGTIVFDVEEVRLEGLFSQLAGAFAEGHRLSGWPQFWVGSAESALQYLQERSIRAFELSSSIGMSGWVLAKAMEIQSVRGRGKGEVPKA